MADLIRLFPGDPAPWFRANTSVRANQPFDLAAGRYILLTFADILSNRGSAAIAELTRVEAMFQDGGPRWMIVTGASQKLANERLPLRRAAISAIFDFTGEIAAAYGLGPGAPPAVSFIISPRLQIQAIIANDDAAVHADQVIATLQAQLPYDRIGAAHGQAPVLMIPNVFEPELCRMLIEGYGRHGGEPSGFMRDEGGRTVRRFDDSFKVRRDWMIADPYLHNQIGARFMRRVVPQIQRAFNFTVGHMERHLVSCYDSSEGGHFAAHRDNTALGTVHRRFACSLNLNDDYEGGDLVFPEFGPQTFRPPPGACVIFGSALLHQATKVTSGRRYAFLPFLHDDAAEAIRKQNARFIDEDASTKPGQAAS
jgi:predicted 2-oxoglutarate/Fe(II)-dependent dioxygenase YbiX